MKARMAQHALHNPEGLDLRTAIILSENGLIPGGVATFAPEAEMLAAIRDPKDPNRIQAPDGPLVLVKRGAGATNANVVVTAAGFLLSEVLEARQAAVSHLESLAASKPTILTERSQAVLNKNNEDLLSEGSWHRAAVNVLDALDEDFLYNLAGLNQCVAINYREGAKNYAPLVLRPSLTAVNAIPIGVSSPSQERERLLGLIEESVRSAASVGALCDDYYARFGHLPLTGEVSLGVAVRKWVAAHGTLENLWSAVWSWADATGGPLPRYHACQVFIENPSFLPEGEKARLWKEIIEALVLPEKDGIEWLEWSLAWCLRYELLCHFAAHFECLAPGEDGERIAVAALWVTERVATALSHRSVDIQHLLDQTVVPTGNHSSGVWQIVRPPTTRPCPLRYAALFGPRLWSLSMLGELGRRIREFAVNTDEQIEERVKDTLMRWLIQSFPPFPGPELPTYAFDRTVVESADAWVKPLEEGEGSPVGAIRSLVQSQKVLADGERLESEIRRLPAGTEASQYVLAQAMRSMAYVGKLPVELMREVLWNDQWRYEVWRELSSTSFAALWDCIVEIQLQQRGDWLVQLSHLWVGMCERLNESDERYGELVDHVILGSINSDTASALKRLLTGPNSTVMKKAADWKQRLEGAIQLGTNWPQAKLRAFLSVFDRPYFATARKE
jgi:hypothetical protein